MGWTARAAAVGSVFAMACSPALDWREVRPSGADLVALFPCKPTSRSRVVVLGANSVKMTMAACQATDLTFVLSFSDVAEPALVGSALNALRAASVANVEGTVRQQGQPSVPGMTPSDQAVRLHIDGHLPNGGVTRLATMLFAHGTVVFQASVVGGTLDDGAIDIFFSSLKFGG